jgi:hypothetical protein
MKSKIMAAALLLLVIGLPAVIAKKPKKEDSPKLLYAKKCAGSCHRLYKPKEYTSEQWTKILDDMSTRAKLTDEESKTIKSYLTAPPADTAAPDQ